MLQRTRPVNPAQAGWVTGLVTLDCGERCGFYLDSSDTTTCSVTRPCRSVCRIFAGK